MNMVHPSEWTSMISGDSDMLSAGGVVSWNDLVALLALVSALVILSSWSSWMNTPGGTTVRMEPTLACSSASSLCPHKIWRYYRPLKLFSSLWTSWQYIIILSSEHDHSLLAWLILSNESPRTLSRQMPSAVEILRLWSNASCLVALLVAQNCICRSHLKISPLGDCDRTT
jgi:cytochrome bd-type quinol oxidase subunit 1